MNNGAKRPNQIPLQNALNVGSSRPGFAKPVFRAPPSAPNNTPANTPNPDIVVTIPQDKINSTQVPIDSKVGVIPEVPTPVTITVQEPTPEEIKQNEIEKCEIVSSQIDVENSIELPKSEMFYEQSSTVVGSSQTTNSSVEQTENVETDNSKEKSEIISSQTIAVNSTSTIAETVKSAVTSSTLTEETLSQSTTSGPISLEECKLISAEIADHFAKKDAIEKIETIKTEEFTEKLIKSTVLSTTTEHVINGISNPAFVEDEIASKIEVFPSKLVNLEFEDVENQGSYAIKGNSNAVPSQSTEGSTAPISTFESFKNFVGEMVSSAIYGVSPYSEEPEPIFNVEEKKEIPPNVNHVDIKTESSEIDSRVLENIEKKVVDTGPKVEEVIYATVNKKIDSKIESKDEMSTFQPNSTEDNEVVSTKVITDREVDIGLSSPALIREIITTTSEVIPSKSDSDNENELITSSVFTDSITYVNVSDTEFHQEVKKVKTSKTIHLTSTQIISEPDIDYDNDSNVSSVWSSSGPTVVEVSTTNLASHIDIPLKTSNEENIASSLDTVASSTYYELSSTSYESATEQISSTMKNHAKTNGHDFSSFDVD